jgi:hypothetical protein
MPRYDLQNLHHNTPQWPIERSSTCPAPVSPDVPLLEFRLGLCTENVTLTYSSQHNHMAILPSPHRGENRLDDVHIGEEVSLEGLVY